MICAPFWFLQFFYVYFSHSLLAGSTRAVAVIGCVQVEAPEPPKAPEVPKVPELPKAQKGIRVRKGKTTMMDLCGLSIPLKERALYFLKFGECYRWKQIDRGVSLLNVVKHNISQHAGSGRVQDITCTYSLRGCWVFRTEETWILMASWRMLTHTQNEFPKTRDSFFVDRKWV